MENLSKIAIKAFEQGSDNYGETATGEVGMLMHRPFNPSTTYFEFPKVKTHKYYFCTVFLVQSDGHPCTSGNGFYVKDKVMEVVSGHAVFTLPVTDEIQEELDEATVVDL